MNDVRTVLGKAEAQLKAFGTLYEADLELQRVSPTLRGKMKAFLDQERSALDGLAEQLVAASGVVDAHVHYPFATEAGKLDASIDKNMPGVRAGRPEVVAAIARHQPFSVPALAQLRDLLVDDKRRRLTPDTRPAPEETTGDVPPAEALEPPADPSPPPPAPGPPPPPSGGFGGGLTGPLLINGIEHDPVTLQPLNAPAPLRRETIYVDWRFEDDDTSALRALEAIHAAVVAAIDEVSAAAGL